MATTNRPATSPFAYIPELKSAWQQVAGTKWAFFVPFVILVLVYLLLVKLFAHEAMYSNSLSASDVVSKALRDMPQLFIYYFFYVGYANLGLRRVRHESVTLSDFASIYTTSRLTAIITYSLFMVVYYVVGSIIASLIGLYISNILIPFFLIILLAVWLKFFMAAFMIVDANKGYDTKEALLSSWRSTSGHLLTLFIVMLIVFGLSLIGAFTLLVGYIWMLPLVMIYSARVYEYLLRA